MAESKIKKENDDGPLECHEHSFKVQIKKTGHKYSVACHEPGTVLQVIKSHLKDKFDENMKSADENILIKLGDDNESLVATHFPCCCVDEGACLVISSHNEPVEVPNQGINAILPREQYSLFFIDKELGQDTKTKTKVVFRETGYFSEFKYFCVYGEKGMTVEEALNQDGRFVNFRGFELSDKEQTITLSTETVNNLDGKKFKICLPRGQPADNKKTPDRTTME